MYLAIGGAISQFEGDYGLRKIVGGTVYMDANPYRRYGLEAEIRKLQYSNSPGMNQITYLGGAQGILSISRSGAIRQDVGRNRHIRFPLPLWARRLSRSRARCWIGFEYGKQN